MNLFFVTFSVHFLWELVTYFLAITFSYTAPFVLQGDRNGDSYRSSHVNWWANPHPSDLVRLTGICQLQLNSISSSLELGDDAIWDRPAVLSTGQRATEAPTCCIMTLSLHGENGRQVHGNEQFPPRLNGPLLFCMSFPGFARMYGNWIWTDSGDEWEWEDKRRMLGFKDMAAWLHEATHFSREWPALLPYLMSHQLP